MMDQSPIGYTFWNQAVARPGAQVLKFWAIDPGLVLQKMVVYTGCPRPSYLGPPESARGRRSSQSS